MATEQTIRMRADRVLTGKDAADLLAGLQGKNPLFGSLRESPNAHLVVFDLTSVGRPSNHQGPMKYQLSKQGLAEAIPTLIAKPIHITADLDGHFTQGADPKPIGVFLGSEGVTEADGSITLRAIGTLWNDDFPEEIEEISKRIAELGASYEITYPPDSAVKLHAGLTEIGSYKFSGGAILKKTAAAHPTTQILVATDTQQYTDDDFALPEGRRLPIHDAPHRMLAYSQLVDSQELSAEEKQTARGRILARALREGDTWVTVASANFTPMTVSTSIPGMSTTGTSFTVLAAAQTPPKEGRTMTMSTKYPGGILAEHDTAVSAVVAAALAAFVAALEPGAPEFQCAEMSEETKKKFRENQKALAELPLLRDKATAHDGFVAKVAELNTELIAAKDKLAEIEPQMEELSTLRAAKLEADKVAAVDGIWTKLKAQYGLTDEQRAEKQPVLDKLAAGQVLAVDDVILLTTGAKQLAGTPAQPAVPLMANIGSPSPTGTTTTPDLAALKKNFAALELGPRFR